jgi:hypothetical protein
MARLVTIGFDAMRTAPSPTTRYLKIINCAAPTGSGMYLARRNADFTTYPLPSATGRRIAHQNCAAETGKECLSEFAVVPYSPHLQRLC